MSFVKVVFPSGSETPYWTYRTLTVIVNAFLKTLRLFLELQLNSHVSSFHEFFFLISHENWNI